MLVQGIKSRPVYTGLTIDNHAQRHLFALEGEGPLALLDQVKAVGNDFLSAAEILYVPGGSKAKDHDSQLRVLNPFDLWSAPTIPVLLNRLKVTLRSARMGTRLYLSGTEGFIGQAMQVALDLGVDFHSIRTEHRGSTARRVQCVHCKGFTDNVTTSPYVCSHCNLQLLVRDHYSRRLGAFQGVCIEAEEPGTAPPPKELFT
jgi:dimethylamine monooxygenase subunit C